MRTGKTLLVLTSVLVAALAGGATTAFAATTYYVAPGGSGTDCAANSQASPFATIQAALSCATDADVVRLAATGGGAYPGIGAVSHNVVIEAAPGADARTVRIDVSQPDATTGLLSVPSTASVTLEGVTIDCISGNCTGPNVTNQGTLALRDVAITGATLATAVRNFSGSATPARLSVIGSTIHDNTNAGGIGGLGAGIESGRAAVGDALPTVTVANSTIADNFTSQGGGGFRIVAGSLSVINSTITGNQANGGAGIYSTSTVNAITLDNTVLAGNTRIGPGTASDCSGRVLDGSAGHNLIGDMTDCDGMTDGINGDQIGVPGPGLGALADNGGPTDTIALQPSSPAIGAAHSDTCLTGPIGGEDQRGFARAAGSACDIGAYEAGATAPPDVTAPSATITTPPDGASYSYNQVVVADYTCADEPGGSGIASCQGTVAVGQPIDTSTTGSHPFTVTATDSSANSTAETVHYTVSAPPGPPTPPTPPGGGADTTAPNTRIVAGPPRKTRSKQARFRFRSTEPGGTFRCKLDKGRFRPCSSPRKIKVRPGRHTLKVRAKDAAGNVDPTPASRTWTVKRKRTKK